MLDVETFEQVQIRRLMNLTECVCICHSPDEKLLAVGCKQNLLFCDAKTLETVKTVQLPELSSLGGRNQERLETSTFQNDLYAKGLLSLLTLSPLRKYSKIYAKR